MKKSDFHYDLPPELIAQRPADTRGGSRLMQVPVDGAPAFGPFADIIKAFRGDEILVINDTRVVPARIAGQKPTGGAVEVFFVEPIGAPGADPRVKAMIRGKRLKVGGEVELPLGASAVIEARHEDGVAELSLRGVPELWGWLEQAGAVPLPPYIHRVPDEADRERYQTVYARFEGSVAAPTAGLHFTDAILDAVKARGVTVAPVTLHVGLGTFLPMRGEAVAEHTMHAERYEVPDETAALLRSGRPVVAVGTTAVRALEAWALDPEARSTSLFITPGFEFRGVDGLLTNFHLPESTLLMLVCAFAGQDRVLSAYRAGIEARMRVYSYGDAMLLRREGGRWT